MPVRELRLDELPSDDDLGSVSRWELPPQPPSDDDDDDDDGRPQPDLVIEGTFLGFGSSEHRTHKNHRDKYAEAGGRCGACRWFETRIFRLGDGTGYLLYHVGVSLVPGERHYVTVDRARTPHEVIECYTRRRGGEAYLTAPSARALAQASGYDDDLCDAYENRAVL